MLKLYFQPDPGPFTLGSSMWSETDPGEGWEETTPEAYEQWLVSRPPLSPPPPPPPPEPEPDFDGMATALRTENGFKSAFRAAQDADPMATGSLTVAFHEFRTSGDYSYMLRYMLLVLSLFPPEQAAEIGTGFLAVAARCHMPPAFLEALQAAFDAE